MYINKKLDPERFREIYKEQAVRMSGGVRTGGNCGKCKGGAYKSKGYRTCEKHYESGPKQGYCEKYKIMGKPPKSAKHKTANDCNPWIIFCQNYHASHPGMTWKQVISNPIVRTNYEQQKEAYMAESEACRRLNGLPVYYRK